MLDVTVPYDDLDELEARMYKLFAEREADIVDGKLDGHQWFVKLVSEAEQLMRRSRVARARSAGRIS